MKTVLLRLGTEAPHEVSWLTMGEGEAIRRGTLSEAGAACRGARVVVLVPATDCLLTRVAIPGRNRKRTIQAAPFALEEQLAEEIEHLHFAFGPKNPDASLEVTVVARRTMRHWLSLLQEAGLTPDGLTPETLALPYADGGWTLLLEGAVALLRCGPRAGMGVDRANLGAVLDALREVEGKGERQEVRVYLSEGAELPPGLNLSPQPLVSQTPALAAMARGLDHKHTINLLQGEFGHETDWQRLLKQWRLPLTLGLILLCLQAGRLGVGLVEGRRESLELERRIEAVYRATFPEAKQVVNPRVQMEARLTALRGGEGPQAGFIGLLTRIGPDLEKSEGCTVQRLRYHGQAIELELTLASLASLDDLKARLKEVGGIEVEIRTASAANDRVSARLAIKEATP